MYIYILYIYIRVYKIYIYSNKDLLYSTGKSTQYSLMTYMGKDLKKSGYMCCTSDTLCYIAETNTNL